jgi:hypothetical protein
MVDSEFDIVSDSGVPTETSGVQRDEPDLNDATKQFVSKWQSKLRAAKKYWDEDFKRMREDMKIARQGASDEWASDGSYTVPIINRYLNQSVASLYAKNPTALAERRETLDFQVWDGKAETAQAAIQAVAQAMQMGIAPDPQSMAVIQDIEQGRQRKEMVDKIGRTLEILYDYYSNEQKPRLKPLMKSLVRRAKTCGVGYIMLGFQRQYAQLSPDDTARLADAREQMGELQRRMQDFVDDKIDSSVESEIYELETLIKQFEDMQSKILREGPLFMFPRSTEIIVDPCCKQLMGFVGAGWIAREFHKSADEIQKIYNVDIKNTFTPYKEDNKGDLAKYHYDVDSYDKIGRSDDKSDVGLVCIWEVYNKELNQTFTIADGYKGFLKPCAEPEYWMEGFWPVFAITFNECESEDHLYPFSDVHQLKHVQAEYNRSREYRRLHREANKPKYMAIKGRLSDQDKELLQSHPPHALVELDGLGGNEQVGNLIQRFQSVPIDPALYETNSEMEDVLRVVGAQEANLGGTSGSTATEASIGEGSRMTGLSSNVDDLDEFLYDVVTAAGQLMLMELSKETVMEIAGIGAVWPELNREQIAKQTLLKVRAGSTGRPNKAAELANIERVLPYALQIPGVNPTALAEYLFELVEINLEDIIVEGMPSITAINAQFSKVQPDQGAGGTPDDPNSQGQQGATNAPNPRMSEPGAQPSYQQPIDNY